VSTLLGLAKPLPAAEYLRFSSGSYHVSLSIEEVVSSSAIIALRLNGEALPQEHGEPCQLIAGAKKGNFSVKWVDLIELTTTPVEDSGRFIDISSSHPCEWLCAALRVGPPS